MVLHECFTSYYFDEFYREFRLIYPLLEKKMPLVIVLHGAGESHDSLIRHTNNSFYDYAREKQFILAYPRAFQEHWNDGRYEEDTADDVLFLENMIQHINQKVQIDTEHIYLVGFSRGGIFSHTFLSHSSLPIKGIATIGAAVSNKLLPPKDTLTKILMINGVKDGVIDFNGSEKSRTLSAKDSFLHYLSSFPVNLEDCVIKHENEDILLIFHPQFSHIQLLCSFSGRHNWDLKNDFCSIKRIIEFFEL